MPAAAMVITLEAHSYRLQAPLARSAYGLVWRAARQPDGRPVALKFVNAGQMLAAAPAQRQRWLDGAHQEACFLGQLSPWDGRHIVRLLDRGKHCSLPVLALELLEGDLGGWMARRRAAGQPGPVRRAFDWIGQVNQALARVHQHGRRHLDVKPSNLLLDEGASLLKLADFGTSRALADRAAHDYAGTPSWQAPEQIFAAASGDASGDASAHEAVDAYATCAATDYFALGALLYYLVGGGIALRFCSEAAQAWRQGQAGAGARLRAHHGGALPPTLHEDEAALFRRHCEQGWASSAAGDAALALLRALLQAEPAQRPAHALAISRLLAAVAMAGRQHGGRP